MKAPVIIADTKIWNSQAMKKAQKKLLTDGTDIEKKASSFCDSTLTRDRMLTLFASIL